MVSSMIALIEFRTVLELNWCCVCVKKLTMGLDGTASSESQEAMKENKSLEMVRGMERSPFYTINFLFYPSQLPEDESIRPVVARFLRLLPP